MSVVLNDDIFLPVMRMCEKNYFKRKVKSTELRVTELNCAKFFEFLCAKTFYEQKNFNKI